MDAREASEIILTFLVKQENPSGFVQTFYAKCGKDGGTKPGLGQR
jgi:hypothetical protein